MYQLGIHRRALPEGLLKTKYEGYTTRMVRNPRPYWSCKQGFTWEGVAMLSRGARCRR